MSNVDSQKRGGSIKRLRELMSVLRKHDAPLNMTPVKLRKILEDLGSTYVKLGQIMSMRSDILPQEYCDELIKLQAEVNPVSFDTIKEVIRKEYQRPISQIFSEIDPVPKGSASIAQVHHAVLREDGRSVVLKVQRPGIHATMEQDIRLMHKAIRLLKIMSDSAQVVDFDEVIDEMWKVAQQEMNFIQEAENNEEFQRLNQEINYVSCPRVHKKLTTHHILVMERIEGIPIDRTRELEELGYDMDEIGSKLAESYFKQVLDDGFFHADPHPGNIWIHEGKIVFLDLGMMGRLSQKDCRLFNEVVSAIAENDVESIKNAILTLGFANKYIDHAKLYEDVDIMLKKYSQTNLSEINMGLMSQELLFLAQKHNISMPSSITMLARGLMTLEGVMAKCCPNVNVADIFKTHVKGELVNYENIEKDIMSALKDIKRSLRSGAKIPADLSDFLNIWIKGHSKLNLEIVGSEEPIKKIDSMINKIIIGLLSASLFIGSSIVCSTEMRPIILGIPLLAWIGFSASFFLCVYLFFKVRKEKKRK